MDQDEEINTFLFFTRIVKFVKTLLSFNEKLSNETKSQYMMTI